MSRSEGFVVYSARVFPDTGDGAQISYSYLSQHGTAGEGAVAVFRGGREWLPLLNDKVQTYWIRQEAELSASVHGGKVAEKALLQRAEDSWLRLEPSSTTEGIEI